MGRGLDGYFDIRALALCGFEGPREARSLPVSGGYCEGETPLPIPNRAVKPLSADGTWPARAWESRSPPVFQQLTTPQDLAADRGVVFSASCPRPSCASPSSRSSAVKRVRGPLCHASLPSCMAVVSVRLSDR